MLRAHCLQLRVAFAVLLLIMASSHSASASSPWPPVIRISPPLGVSAPRNTKILVKFPLGWQARYLPGAAHDSLENMEVILRSISTGASVAARRLDHKQVKHTVVELNPSQLLTPGDFELAVIHKKESAVLGELRVGNVVDDKAPELTQQPMAYYSSDYSGVASGAKQSLCQLYPISAEPDDSEDNFPKIVAQRTDASDDKTPKRLIRMAVWLQSKRGSIDYQQAPALYVLPGWHPYLFPEAAIGLDLDMRVLWQDVPCARFAESGVDPMNLRIGIRPMDLAGNLGPAWEATVPPSTQGPPPLKPPHTPARSLTSMRPNYAQAPLPALDHFKQAVHRSVAAGRWLLAYEQCTFAQSLVGSMPALCRTVPAHAGREFHWILM